MATPEGMRFGIYDARRKSGAWVGLNERGADFVVKDYRLKEGADQVTVDYAGGAHTLVLKQARVAAAKPVPVDAAPAPTATAAPPPLALSSASLLPAEKARLDALALQVQRRIAQERAAARQPKPPPAR
jgi:hypothetical protein